MDCSKLTYKIKRYTSNLSWDVSTLYLMNAPSVAMIISIVQAHNAANTFPSKAYFSSTEIDDTVMGQATRIGENAPIFDNPL